MNNLDLHKNGPDYLNAELDGQPVHFEWDGGEWVRCGCGGNGLSSVHGTEQGHRVTVMDQDKVEALARDRFARERERGLATGRMTPLHVGDVAYVRLSGDTFTVTVADVRGDHLIDVTGSHFMLRNVVGWEPAPVDEHCPHGYHVTEGHCPVCDLDRDGKCGPYCQHNHSDRTV